MYIYHYIRTSTSNFDRTTKDSTLCQNENEFLDKLKRWNAIGKGRYHFTLDDSKPTIQLSQDQVREHFNTIAKIKENHAELLKKSQIGKYITLTPPCNP